MHKFKVGDRVAVYSPSGRYTGEVIALQADGFLNIRYTSSSGQGPAHPKQCRKLIPKKRRSVWIRKDQIPNKGSFYGTNVEPCELDLYFEFREVIKK